MCCHILVGAWPYSQRPAKGRFLKSMSPISSYWVCASCKLTFITSIHLLDLYGDYNWVSEQVNWEFSYWVTLPVQQEEMTLQFDYNTWSIIWVKYFKWRNTGDFQHSRYENNKTTTNKHAKSRQPDSSDNYQSQNNRFLWEYFR